MAGLPPFIGFISKEYLFEAKLASAFDPIAVIIGVMVNAVMVAVAGVLALKPFFGRAKKAVHVEHGERAGMTVGPLLLAVIGVTFGIVPSLVSYALIGPAAIAIHGAPFEVSFKLWHGFTPMLALSGLVVVLGATLAWFWDPIHLALRRRRGFDEVFLDRGYDLVLGRTLALARWSDEGAPERRPAGLRRGRVCDGHGPARLRPPRRRGPGSAGDRGRPVAALPPRAS